MATANPYDLVRAKDEHGNESTYRRGIAESLGLKIEEDKPTVDPAGAAVPTKLATLGSDAPEPSVEQPATVASISDPSKTTTKNR